MLALDFLAFLGVLLRLTGLDTVLGALEFDDCRAYPFLGYLVRDRCYVGCLAIMEGAIINLFIGRLLCIAVPV